MRIPGMSLVLLVDRISDFAQRRKPGDMGATRMGVFHCLGRRRRNERMDIFVRDATSLTARRSDFSSMLRLMIYQRDERLKEYLSIDP